MPRVEKAAKIEALTLNPCLQDRLGFENRVGLTIPSENGSLGIRVVTSDKLIDIYDTQTPLTGY